MFLTKFREIKTNILLNVTHQLIHFQYNNTYVSLKC